MALSQQLLCSGAARELAESVEAALTECIAGAASKTELVSATIEAGSDLVTSARALAGHENA